MKPRANDKLIRRSEKRDGYLTRPELLSEPRRGTLEQQGALEGPGRRRSPAPAVTASLRTAIPGTAGIPSGAESPAGVGEVEAEPDAALVRASPVPAGARPPQRRLAAAPL